MEFNTGHSEVFKDFHPSKNSEESLANYALRKRKRISYADEKDDEDDDSDSNSNHSIKKINSEPTSNIVSKDNSVTIIQYKANKGSSGSAPNILKLSGDNSAATIHYKTSEVSSVQKNLIFSTNKSFSITPTMKNNSSTAIRLNVQPDRTKKFGQSNMKFDKHKNFPEKSNKNETLKFSPSMSNDKSKTTTNRISSIIQSSINTITDTDLDCDNLFPKWNFDLFSHSNKDNSSSDALQIQYKFECFHLNCNDLVNNVGNCLDFDSESEIKAKNYLPCLKQIKKYFNNVKPLKANPTLHPKQRRPEDLEYDPDLDDLPNYNEYTELELSLLQKISCGCKALTWDEFQKMNVKVPYIDDDEREVLTNSTKSSNFNKEDVILSKPIGRKYIITDNKFHYHHHRKVFNVYVDELCSSVEDTELHNSVGIDPLKLCQLNIEMVDGNEAISYKIHETGNKEIPEENIEILPSQRDHIDILKSRLNSFRLNSILCEDSLEYSSHGTETVLQANTITEEEFSSSIDEVVVSKMQETGFSSECIDILSKAIYQELIEKDESLSVQSQNSNASLRRNSTDYKNSSSSSSENNYSFSRSQSAANLIEAASSILGENRNLELSSQQNFPNINSLTLEDTIKNDVVGKILSNDDIKLLSQCQLEKNTSDVVFNNETINTTSVPVVPVVSEVLIPVSSSNNNNSNLNLSSLPVTGSDGIVFNPPVSLPGMMSSLPEMMSSVDERVVDTILTQLLNQKELSDVPTNFMG